jgi:hypothetical protein
MRIGTIIPVSFFLLQSCAHAPAREVVRPADNPPVTAAAAMPQIPVFTAISALTTIMSEKPNAVSFGEIHKGSNPANFTPTNMRFAEEILPYLPSFGIMDIVVEFLPDDPAADAEIAVFFIRGALGADTPILNQWISGTEAAGKLRIMEVARENGMTIHGGNMNQAECPDPFQIHEMFEEDPNTVSNLVRNHTMRRMEQVLSEGRSVASYVGIRHNNYAPESWDAEASFGDELFVQTGIHYIEVDLIVPELIAGNERHIGLADPQSYIPASGVSLVDQSPRYVIFFPRSL